MDGLVRRAVRWAVVKLSRKRMCGLWSVNIVLGRGGRSAFLEVEEGVMMLKVRERDWVRSMRDWRVWTLSCRRGS